MIVYDSIQKIAQKYNNTETDYQVMAVAPIYDFSRTISLIDDVADVIPWQFECFEVPIPVGYDRILKTFYGNYWEFPPVEQRGVWHNDLFINTEVPYKISSESNSRTPYNDRKY